MVEQGKNDAKKLPRFRKDLRIYTGPLEVDGSPTFNLYDPAKGKYFKISWKESLVFKSHTEELTAEELAIKIGRQFPISVTTDDVNHFFAQAHMLGLLRLPKDGEALYQVHTRAKETWSSWFIMNYLFLKIPLFHPDAFLTRTLPYVRFFGSKLALWLYFIVIVVGFAAIIGRLDQFFHTFSYFFTIEGVILYATMVSCVKIVHEFSHAYTAKNFGLYVPTMGVGLLVLWPVLFTDVTEGWKLARRRERFYISFAGVAAEMVMAGFASIGWILSSPGIFQSLCFVLASTSWFSTIVVNVNPAVRFDGYYILADLWGIDNLMSRAFAVTRWKFHQWLLGINMECPEDNLSPRREAGMIVFTCYVLTYRFFLYTAIALFVYFEFTKVLGVGLFLAEIWIFFILPVVWEVNILHHIRSKLSWNWRSIITSVIVSLVLIWFVVPWPHKVSLPAVIISEKLQMIYAPEDGQIQQITAKRGQEVVPGVSLIRLDSDVLHLEIAKSDANVELLKNELTSYLSNPEAESLLAQKKAEIAENEQILQGLNKRAAKLDVKAEISGQISDWQTNLSVGQYVSKGEIFGSIMNYTDMEAVVFISEIEAGYFHVGQEAEVLVQKSAPLFLKGKVKTIDLKRTNTLIYPSLASIFGGPLAVTAQRNIPGELSLRDSYYQVVIALDSKGKDLYFGDTAEIKMRGPWRSYFVEMLKYVYRAVYKESSF